MKVLRQVNQFQLNEGTLQAKGLFNITEKINNLDETTPSFDDDFNCSLWFDEDEANILLNLSDELFITEAKNLIKED
jgi:hypothetical protein